MIESLLVVLIVIGAAGFSAVKLGLRPRSWRQRLQPPAAAKGTAVPPAAGPYAGCAGCPAGADCGKRR